MRVCYFGTYDQSYSRNRNIIDGLRGQGVAVTECHVHLWRGTADKVAAMGGGWQRLFFPIRLLGAWARLIAAYRRAGDYDVMVVGYSGHLDMPLARLLTRLRGKPLVFDAFMSLVLLAEERRLAPPGGWWMRTVTALEDWACRAADMIWMDTPQYIDYLRQLHNLPPDRFRLIPLGADERFFYRLPAGSPSAQPQEAVAGNRRFTALYFGKYVPIHGVETIVRAAGLLRHEQPDVSFLLIGSGQTKPTAVALARQLGLMNVRFVDWVDKSELAHVARDADVCLGVFGDSTQAHITLPNKIYEGMALGKPVVTGRTRAAAEAFVDGEHVLLCPPGDAEALAQAILRLRDDPALRKRLADGGHRLFREQYTIAAVGACAQGHLEELLNRWRGSR